MAIRITRALGWVGGPALVLAAPALGGCSFIFVDGPPSHPERISPQSEVSCTTSKAAPIIDTVITGLEVVRVGLAAGASDADYSGAPISRQSDIGLGVGFAALFGASAVYGYVVTGKCKDVKASRGYERSRDAPDSTRENWTPPPPQPQSTPAPAPAPPPAPARACAPGATQPCVGPGACSGGQACSEGGMAWLPCQCAPDEEEE